MLALEDVAKGFEVNSEIVRVIDDVSLLVQPGEMVALHGPSGSGKTTLLLLIAALLAPDRGSIRFQGRELTRLSDAEISQYLHREVGFVHQSAQLMPRVSAIENAAMKLVLGGISMREAQARALPWLQRVGLGDRVQSTPEQLSAGERQRVTIARALSGDPRLLLADEPTGSLDRARSAEIVKLLRAVAHDRGAAVMLVTHDLDAAKVADRCFALQDGRLIERERPKRPVAGSSAAALRLSEEHGALHA